MKRFVIVVLGGLLLATSIVFGGISPAGAAEPARTTTGCEGYSDSVVRLYSGAFQRLPEQDGFDYWMGTYTAGRMSLTEIAEFFTESPEFESLYGNLDDTEFIDRLYLNVMERPADDEGLAFWLGQLAVGVPRATLLLRFTESPELVGLTGTAIPTDGYYTNGLTGSWICRVDQTDLFDVAQAFIEFATDSDSTQIAILGGGTLVLEPPNSDSLDDWPETQDGFAPGVWPNGDPDYPACAEWFLGYSCQFEAKALDGSDLVVHVRLYPEGIQFDGSGWTGRWVVVSYINVVTPG